jgi:hypothetical protein
MSALTLALATLIDVVADSLKADIQRASERHKAKKLFNNKMEKVVQFPVKKTGK